MELPIHLFKPVKSLFNLNLVESKSDFPEISCALTSIGLHCRRLSTIILNCHFSFFGAYESKESNLGGNDDIDTIHFIDSLRGKTNTQFHGILSQNDLAINFEKWMLF